MFEEKCTHNMQVFSKVSIYSITKAVAEFQHNFDSVSRKFVQFKLLASPRGFEPPTPGLGIPCSIRLSYGDAIQNDKPIP